MNLAEMKYVFPDTLSEAALREITEVVSAACAGNIIFRPHPLRVRFRAATLGILQLQRQQDGSAAYWTETPHELEMWFHTYWCPLHQAAIDADQVAWRRALVRLFVSEAEVGYARPPAFISGGAYV